MRSLLFVVMLGCGLCGCSAGTKTAAQPQAQQVKAIQTKSGRSTIGGSAAMPKEPAR